MIDPEDRWLEHALRGALGEGSEHGADLSVAIREAWARGERRLAPRRVPRVRPGGTEIEEAAPAAQRRVRWHTPNSRRPAAAVAAGLLAVAGVAGWVTLHGGGSPEDVPHAIPVEPAPLPVITASERAFAKGLLGLASGDPLPDRRLENLRQDLQFGLVARLRDEPELWRVAAPALDELLEPGRVPAYVARELVSALAVDPSPEAAEVIRATWLKRPEDFSSDAIVAMAERGAFEFIREVEQAFDVDSEIDADPSLDVLPMAAYLALRGDAAGAETLAGRASLGASLAGAEADSPKTIEGLGPWVLSAAGLQALGDGQPMARLLDTYSPWIATWIEEGNLEAARGALDWLAYGNELAREGGPVAFAGYRVQARREADGDEEKSATELLDALEALSH